MTGATLNMGGRLVVRATAVGADTRLAQLTQLVSQALTSKADAQRLADRVASVFVPCVISLAVATLGFWLGSGLPGQAAWSAVFAVLVVVCPCALGLATPTALLAAVGRGAQLGILIKSAQTLESASGIRVVVLDKTGTLTTATMTLHAVTMPGDGGVGEKGGPAARRGRGGRFRAPRRPGDRPGGGRAPGSLPAVTGFTSLAGAGVQGTVDGLVVTVGSPRLFGELSLAVPRELRRARGGSARRRPHRGPGRLERAGTRCAGRRGRPQAGQRGRCGTHPQPRPAPHPAHRRQRARRPRGRHRAGHPSGQRDLRCAARRESQGHPRAAGRRVRRGDGVNDAAALAQADLGMAIGTGADAAIGTADLTLVSGDPHAVAEAVQLARATLRVIRANLAWAFGYNVVAIPLAASGYLNPLLAGTAMAASSLIVVSNSLRLRRFHARAATARRMARPPRPRSRR